MIPITFNVPKSLEGERLDKVISFVSDLPRSAVATLIEDGKVKIDGTPALRRSRPLSHNQVIEVDTAGIVTDIAREDPSVQFELVYSDQDIAVINKPAGLVVHHGAGHHEGTLVDGLIARFDTLRDSAAKGTLDPARPGIVHRLDKETSGLMVVGLTPFAVERLVDQISSRKVIRQYIALVAGLIPEDNGMVDAPIGRSSRNPLNMCVSSNGRPAVTRYRVVRRYVHPVPLSLLEVNLETGRTHQIRVHMSSVGHPVIGDVRYGGHSWSVLPPVKLPDLNASYGTLDAGLGQDTSRQDTSGRDAGLGQDTGGQGVGNQDANGRDARLGDNSYSARIFLHASRLSIEHPSSGELMDWSVPLPPELSSVLEVLDS